MESEKRRVTFARRLICMDRIVHGLLVVGVIVAVAAPGKADQYAFFGHLILAQAGNDDLDITGLGEFSATGPNPRPVVVPAHQFDISGMAFRVFPTVPQVAQFEQTFTHTQPITETFVAGGGPGFLSFCPRAGNPVNPNCLIPASATGGREGRITYSAGANQFGGTFSFIRKGTGSVSRRVATAPLQFNHVPNTQMGPSGPALPTSSTITIPQGPPGVVTQSPVLSPDGAILTPGPVVGTNPAPITVTRTGFPATTGMIVHSRTVPDVRTFSMTGSDARTALGFGNITLVAGATTQSSTTGGEYPWQMTHVYTVPEPTFYEMIAGGTLLLLIVSHARVRRARRC